MHLFIHVCMHSIMYVCLVCVRNDASEFLATKRPVSVYDSAYYYSVFISISIYLYIHIYIYIYTHIYMHAHMYVHMYHTCMCIYKFVCIYIHVYVHVHVHAPCLLRDSAWRNHAEPLLNVHET
jgi:hypothetical protein